MSQIGLVIMSLPLIARTVYCDRFLMNGEKTPCIPSLVPVVQLAQPGKLLGNTVERRGALVPSRISRARTGSLPALARGLIISNVAPSSPIITVFIYCEMLSEIGNELSHSPDLEIVRCLAGDFDDPRAVVLRLVR